MSASCCSALLLALIPYSSACLFSLLLSLRFVGSWHKYLSLWSLDVDGLSAQLGEDVPAWNNVLATLRRERSVIGDTQDDLQFGPLNLDVSEVRAALLARLKRAIDEVKPKLRELVQARITAIREVRSLHCFVVFPSQPLPPSCVLLRAGHAHK